MCILNFFISPSGCTFWGKKPWSRKKKILWQLGTLVGAPVGIALLAGIAVPAMIIGIPIWVGRKLYARFKTASKHKRNVIITSGVAASVSPSILPLDFQEKKLMHYSLIVHLFNLGSNPRRIIGLHNR